jgi:radical SAM superfamily enzyme YgiQ (UPF0313 family)
MDFYTEPHDSFIRGMIISGSVVFTSRGCPYRCAFCSSRNVFGKSVRCRSAKNVVDEIEFLVNNYGIDGFYILDDTFTVIKKHVINICNELKRRKLDLIWGCETRVNLINTNILRIMKDSGCVQIDFGVESGSQKILNILQKDITIRQIKRAFNLCHKLGIRTYANFMINNPQETFEDIEKTRKLAKTIKPTYSDVWITTPFPGTKLEEMFGVNLTIKDYKKLIFVGEYTSEPIVKSEAFKNTNLGKLRFDLSEEFKKFNLKSESYSLPIKKIIKSKHATGYLVAYLKSKIFKIYNKMPPTLQKLVKRGVYEKI